MRLFFVFGVGLVASVGLSTGIAAAADVNPGAPVAGVRASLLPTQQRIRPVGKQVNLGLFPTGIALSADGRLLLATNNGFLFESVTVVDTETLSAVDTQMGSPPSADVLFMGVAMSADGRTGYAAGHTGTAGLIYTVTLAPGPSMVVGTPITLPDGSFPAGLAISPAGDRLYVAENLADKLAIIDTQTRTLVAEVPVGRQPWGVAVHPSLPQVYVTNRVDQTVSVVDVAHRAVLGTVASGGGPNAVAVSLDGGKIFVANANTDDLTVFDVNHMDHPRRVSLSPFPNARPGSSPNALTFAADGSRLYVANAWDNDIAVVDPYREELVGLIPTGWYPTAIVASPDNRTLYVTNMKGGRTYPRTKQRQSLDFNVNKQLGGTYGVHGTLQILPVPSDRMLTFLDARVKQNNGFLTGVRPSNALPPNGPCSPIPCLEGQPSDKIKHVVFIVRENKTYDQDLGDLAQGDGEPAFVLYPQSVTPNLHKLVQEFVLLDRFFADTEKSESGHQWTTAAIDSDYIEKTWTSATVGGAGSHPDDIGGQDHGIRGYVEPVAQPAGLYWFDNCFTHNVSFRNYGEFIRKGNDGAPVDYWVNNSDLKYHVFDLDYSDQLRVDEWMREFEDQKRGNSFPQFTYLTLPNDHTKGTGAGVPDPRSFVADNDLATGRVIEAISHSRFWPDTVIFLLEDDSQSGADHVDSHRTVGTVIGPYVRRHYVTHTRFDMASMHRTMELILGLPPMSQFDQMAIPMREVFIGPDDQPDMAPYTAEAVSFPMTLVRPGAPGAEISERQDWRHPDRVPDALLNKLLWDYLKGVGKQP